MNKLSSIVAGGMLYLAAEGCATAPCVCVKPANQVEQKPHVTAVADNSKITEKSFEYNDDQEVIKFIRLSRGRLETCFNRILKRNPYLKGKLLVKTSIDTDGKPKEVLFKESSTINNEELISCVSSVVSTFQFSPAIDKKKRALEFPLIFVSGD